MSPSKRQTEHCNDNDLFSKRFFHVRTDGSPVPRCGSCAMRHPGLCRGPFTPFRSRARVPGAPEAHFQPVQHAWPSDMYQNAHPHSNRNLPGGVAQWSEHSGLAFGASYLRIAKHTLRCRFLRSWVRIPVLPTLLFLPLSSSRHPAGLLETRLSLPSRQELDAGLPLPQALLLLLESSPCGISVDTSPFSHSSTTASSEID